MPQFTLEPVLFTDTPTPEEVAELVVAMNALLPLAKLGLDHIRSSTTTDEIRQHQLSIAQKRIERANELLHKHGCPKQ